MLEVFEAAIAPANLPYTILLGLIILYWVLYLLGTFGSDALDFLDFDFDADTDVDVDLDADVDGGMTGHGSALGAFLHFFHVGDVPIIVIFSILALAMWLISMLSTHFLGTVSMAVGLMLVVPIVLGGLIMTKALVMPMAPYLKAVLTQEGESVEIIGRRCTVTSLEVTPRCGQAEIQTEGAPILLNVKTREGATLKKGDEAVVFDHDSTKNVYLIAPMDVDPASAEEESQ
ncbi:MAG TPA: hypothetical protein DD670_04425 [Planctomycetaceae bacterium]|nr:hypothetical protein [Planctomycetaceae bacterium]